MVVLDATIVTIAIPSAQEALHFSTESRQWIVTAYALAFGSLLLLGGKLGDLFGRKWTLIAGLVGFSIASAIGGLAQSFGVLVVARALQGVFAALLAPSALGLLTVTFEGSPDRPKAFGVFGAIAGGGASFGLILGGALTQVLSWRWCLYVNLVIAVPTTIVAWRLLVNQRAPQRQPIDIPGVLTSALGLFALVYGFSNAETHSWTARATIVALIASPVLLTAFVLIERRAKHPLLPLHIIWDRAAAAPTPPLRWPARASLPYFCSSPTSCSSSSAFHRSRADWRSAADGCSGGHLDHRADPGDPTHRGQAADTRRHDARGDRDVPVHAPDTELQLCQ
jgi:MFS family permease